MASYVRGRLAAARVSAAVAVAGMMSAIGIDLAQGERGDDAQNSAARKIGTRDIRDGSLLYKDFKRGQLEKRFPRLSAHKEVAGKLGLLSAELKAGDLDLAGKLGLLSAELKAGDLDLAGKLGAAAAELKADLTGKLGAVAQQSAAIENRLGDLDDVLAGSSITDSSAPVPLLEVAGLARVQVSTQKLGTIHVTNLGTAALRYVAEVNGAVVEGSIAPGAVADITAGAAPSQTDIQVISPQQLATFSVAGTDALAGQQGSAINFFGQAVAVGR